MLVGLFPRQNRGGQSNSFHGPWSHCRRANWRIPMLAVFADWQFELVLIHAWGIKLTAEDAEDAEVNQGIQLSRNYPYSPAQKGFSINTGWWQVIRQYILRSSIIATRSSAILRALYG